jgi:DNA (cytosine-5)-methyltransferase 1
VIAAELCAGAGGTALGLEQAGFEHAALVEVNGDACATLRLNRPGWPVVHGDIARGHLLAPVDLLSSGLPCTPHSRGGYQLGEADERHLWSDALRIIGEAGPRAVMLETSDAIFGWKFAAERAGTVGQLCALGYFVRWEQIDCLWFGVSQHRERALLVAFREPAAAAAFRWPAPVPERPPTVGELLYPRLAAHGWPGAGAWRDVAGSWAPTIVGGSEKHGGPDLGPSQTKAAWRRLGVNPLGVADDVPGPDGKFSRGNGKTFSADKYGPMLTIRMGAELQGFPDDWHFSGGKTSRWRQIGNAFCPPVARAVGTSIRTALAER